MGLIVVAVTVAVLAALDGVAVAAECGVSVIPHLGADGGACGLVLGGACRDGVYVGSQPIVETLAVENGSLGTGGRGGALV